MKTMFSFASQVCAQAQILRVKNLIFHTDVLVSGIILMIPFDPLIILIYFGQIVCCNYNIYLRKYIMTVLSEN